MRFSAVLVAGHSTMGLEGSSSLSTELSEDEIENREPSSITFQPNLFFCITLSV